GSEDDLGPGRPAPVHSGLANAGSGRQAVNAETTVAHLCQQLTSGPQHRLVDPRGSRAAAPIRAHATPVPAAAAPSRSASPFRVRSCLRIITRPPHASNAPRKRSHQRLTPMSRRTTRREAAGARERTAYVMAMGP